jgi:hypothetical protein
VYYCRYLASPRLMSLPSWTARAGTAAWGDGECNSLGSRGLLCAVPRRAQKVGLETASLSISNPTPLS